MTTTNPTPTQPETLEPNVHALTVLVCQDCIDLRGEMCNNPQCVFCRRTMAEVQHYLDAMLLCPVVDGKRLILVGNAVTDEDSTRRAAVTAPRGDVATTARNRDVAQRVVMSTEGVLGERFDIATRHELADRITAALDAATSSPTPAEFTEDIVGDYVCDAQPNCGWRSSGFSRPLSRGTKVGCPNCLGNARFIGATSAPAERTRVAGEQDVRLRLESVAEPWICVEDKPCEEVVPVHWDEMITALVAAEQRRK